MTGPVFHRTIVRCTQNRFDTPLFSYDSQGIYIRCKDCRSVDTKTQEVKRGAFHLITWAQLFRLMLHTAIGATGFAFGLNEGGIHDKSISGGSSGGSNGFDRSDEIIAGDGEHSPERDQGGRMDESEFSVSGLSVADPNSGA